MARYKNSQGKPVQRCTKVIENIGWNKRALMMWARKLALSGVDPLKISKSAANAGTLTHAFIESHIYNAPSPNTDGYSFDHIAIAQNGLDIYRKWESQHSIEYLESEYWIISESGNWGGTADAICTLDGQLCLVDFKTSKAVYPDHVIQVAAYKHGIEEMSTYDNSIKQQLSTTNKINIVDYPKIDSAVIVHINKDLSTVTDNIVTLHILTPDQLELGWKGFQYALGLQEIKDKLI